MIRTVSILLVTLMLLVACGGDDDGGGDDAIEGTAGTSPQMTATSDDDEGDEVTDEGEEDDADSGDSSDEEGPHAPLAAGSSAEVDSHDPDPTALDSSGNFDTSPIKVTIVSIIDPAITESEIFPPGPGNRYWAVEVLMEAVGDTKVNTGEPWTLTDTDGKQYDRVLLSEAAADVGDDIMYAAIEPGQSVQGVVVFLIPEDAQVESLSVSASIYVGGTITFDAP
jgi:hypothetical protein